MDKDNRINIPTTEKENVNEELLTENSFEEHNLGAYQTNDEMAEEAVAKEHAKPKKKKKKKRKKSKNYLLRILVFIGVVAAVIAVLHIDYFDVTTINVTGNEYLTEKQVLKESDIEIGRNIFDTHPTFEEKKIKNNPYVETVEVSRELPDTINVVITEPTGMAQFEKDNKFVVTNNSGKVLEISSVERKVPKVYGITIDDAVVGEALKVAKSSDNAYGKSLELLKAASENDMFFKSVTVENGRVTAYIYKKLKVKGSYVNVIEGLKAGTIRTVAYDIYQKGKTKGTIYVSADNYCSFTKK